jgi:hypothetical protein
LKGTPLMHRTAALVAEALDVEFAKVANTCPPRTAS